MTLLQSYFHCNIAFIFGFAFISQQKMHIHEYIATNQLLLETSQQL